ncbi:MAG: acyl carrier protein [Actinomycetota bacterium]
MATGNTASADVIRDLLTIQYGALKAVRDYGRYLRDADAAGLPEVTYFIRLLLEEDKGRAAHCQGLLSTLSSACIAGLPPPTAGRPQTDSEAHPQATRSLDSRGAQGDRGR